MLFLEEGFSIRPCKPKTQHGESVSISEDKWVSITVSFLGLSLRFELKRPIFLEVTDVEVSSACFLPQLIHSISAQRNITVFFAAVTLCGQ